MTTYILIAISLLFIVLYIRTLLQLIKSQKYNEEIFKAWIDTQQENARLKGEDPEIKFMKKYPQPVK